MNENALISEILNGNTQLFGQLVNAYQRKVFSTCMGFVHHHEDAQDLAQEVFVKAFKGLPTFKGNASFSTWIYRIAVNSCLAHLRKQSRTRFFPFLSMGVERPETVDNNTPHQQAEINELQKQLKESIDSLPENQRIAFVLSKYDDMPQAEIATVMMLTEGAVESLLQRAKKNLRKKLTDFA